MPSLMKAWRLERPGGALALKVIPVPEPRPGSVLVRIEVSALMSYLKGYVEGKLPFYNPPQGEFNLSEYGARTVLGSVEGDMPFKDIARALNCPIGTVLARAHRALGKLRGLMEWSHDATEFH